jgi:hypothetical protein
VLPQHVHDFRFPIGEIDIHDRRTALTTRSLVERTPASGQKQLEF